MKLTEKLLNYAHQILSKSPDRFIALRVRSSGSLSWSIEDATLVLVTAIESISVSLADYTIASLAEFLSSKATVSVEYMAPESHLSALVLIDGAANQNDGNGDCLYGFGSLVWAYMEPLAAELTESRNQIGNMVDQMSIPSADAEWLDEWGGYFGIRRLAGETDAIYGPRIIAESLLPRGNNIAIEMAIGAATGGFKSEVTDAPMDSVFSGIQRDGFTRFDGTRARAPIVRSFYGQFDVNADFDLLSSENISDLMVRIRSAIDKFRDAGTRLRQVQLSGFMSDVAGPHSDDVTLNAHEALSDVSAPPIPLHDGSVMRGAMLPITYLNGARDGSLDRRGWRAGSGILFSRAPDSMAASISVSCSDEFAVPSAFDGLTTRAGTLSRSGFRHTGLDDGSLVITRRFARNGIHHRGTPVAQLHDGTHVRSARRDGSLRYNHTDRLAGAVSYAGAIVHQPVTYSGQVTSVERI